MQTKRWLFITVVAVLLGLFLAACNSSPSSWSYQYETANFETDCPTGLSEEERFAIYGYKSGITTGTTPEFSSAIEKLQTTETCRQEAFNVYLNTKGEQGWEVVSIERITDVTFEVVTGYRALWKKSN